MYSRIEKHYQDYENAQKEMFYDKNGALVADFDRKICTIRNNLLTLPDTIQFSNGNQIVHNYDLMGNRLRTTYYTRKVALVEPATNTILGTDNLLEYNIVSYAMIGNKRYVRYNHGSWALEYVYNPEGYIKYWGEEEHYPYYYIKDHLGSVRETYINPYPNGKFSEQRMQYYPSGLPWNTNLSPSYQPFKYGGKEFVEMHGSDVKRNSRTEKDKRNCLSRNLCGARVCRAHIEHLYDSQARWYYPAIMRTTSMDPLCEKYYSTSPYAWCGNNPVNFVDPDGRDWYKDTLNNIVWTDLTSQKAMDEAGVIGIYLGEAVVVFSGFYNEQLGENGMLIDINGNMPSDAKMANVTVYGPNGEDDIANYLGYTMSSDPKLFGVLANGEYSVTRVADLGPYKSSWAIENRGNLPTLYDTNPAHPDRNPAYINGVFIHRYNNNGLAGTFWDKERHRMAGRSEGCLLVEPRKWDNFMKQLQKVNSFHLILNRQ